MLVSSDSLSKCPDWLGDENWELGTPTWVTGAQLREPSPPPLPGHH